MTGGEGCCLKAASFQESVGLSEDMSLMCMEPGIFLMQPVMVVAHHGSLVLFCLLVATCQKLYMQICNVTHRMLTFCCRWRRFVRWHLKGGSPRSIKKGEEGNPQSKLMTKSPRKGWEGTTKTTKTLEHKNLVPNGNVVGRTLRYF